MPKTKKASVLAYSLIIIAMMLAIVASLSAATILSKKGSSATDASVQAYQTADSGIQIAIKEINSDLNATILDSFPDCDSGVIKNQNDAGAGQYTLSFYDSSDDQITSCSALVNSISSIKSVGVYKDTVRAVNVAMAAGSSGTTQLGTDCHEVIAPKCSGTVSCPSSEYMSAIRTIWDYPNCDGNFIYSVTCCK
jgi:hypothetical protein